MNFKINTNKLTSTFFVPKAVVDEHIKLAGGTQLKVLLYCFNHIGEEINANNIAAALKLSVTDVNDALGFWSELDYFITDKAQNKAETEPKKVIKKEIIKPRYEDIIDLAKDDDKIKFILDEAQKKFGRLLRANETSTLVWLYADEGLSPAVILMAIDYSITIDKASIGYIEKLCIDWLNSGVDTTLAAEERIKTLLQTRDAWYKVSSVFGLVKRSPSKNEEKLSYKWVYEYGYKRDILKEAYNRTIDSIGEYNIKYIAKVIDSWFSLGVKEYKDIEILENQDKKKETKKQKEDYSGYKKDDYKSKLDEDYK